MLTIDFDRLGLLPGHALLDLGCGAGRHTFEALRRGADVVALDQNAEDLAGVEAMVAAMVEAGEVTAPKGPVTVRADALDLPFGNDSFDRVIASEILEHVPQDGAAIAEIFRVVRPGGLVAVSVPRRWPERICWALSDDYHEVEGGHVRIYRGDELLATLEAAGLEPLGSHYAHALHSPYWWLKCASGVERENPLTQGYHRMLVWDMMSRPWLTQTAERLLNPILGKSLVLYLRKPAVPTLSTSARLRQGEEGEHGRRVPDMPAVATLGKPAVPDFGTPAVPALGEPAVTALGEPASEAPGTPAVTA